VRLRNRLVKAQSGSLVLLIVRSVGCLDRALGLALFCLNLCIVNLEKMGIECDLLGLRLDLEVDINLALVTPCSTKLEVVERKGVVRRLDATLLSMLGHASVVLG